MGNGQSKVEKKIGLSFKQKSLTIVEIITKKLNLLHNQQTIDGKRYAAQQ